MNRLICLYLKIFLQKKLFLIVAYIWIRVFCSIQRIYFHKYVLYMF